MYWRSEPARRPLQRDRLLLLFLAILIEGGLGVGAVVWAQRRAIPLWSHIYGDWRALLWIIVATALMAGINLTAYVLALRRQYAVVLHFDRLVVPIFSASGWPDLLLISLLAGVAEETMFRGVIQQELGIVWAGVLFGLMHFVEPRLWPYTCWAMVIGMVFGCLYLWTGNLLVPIGVHAAYDFIALHYLQRRGRNCPAAP